MLVAGGVVWVKMLVAGGGGWVKMLVAGGGGCGVALGRNVFIGACNANNANGWRGVALDDGITGVNVRGDDGGV